VDGLLSDLAPHGIRHRTSMYADDVVTFLNPTRLVVLVCATIVEDFIGASEIFGAHQSKWISQGTFCIVSWWTGHASTRVCISCMQDNFTPCPWWITHQEGCSRGVPRYSIVAIKRSLFILLCVIPMHAIMSLGIPPKTMQARRDVMGGHCLVVWDRVASPKDNGGLGLPNLQLMNLALRC
jgi:hypothetical protein